MRVRNEVAAVRTTAVQMPVTSSKSLLRKKAESSTLVFVLLLFFYLPLAAQQQTSDSARPFWSQALGTIAYTPESEGWYRFKPGVVKEGKLLFVAHKKAFGLGNDDSMRFVHTQKMRPEGRTTVFSNTTKAFV